MSQAAMLQWAMVLALAAAGILDVRCIEASPSFTYRWAYRNPLSITDLSALDQGKGSYNGTVNSDANVATPSTMILRYSHGASTAFLPNGSFAVIWQGSPLWWEGNMQQAAYWALSDDDGRSFGPATLLHSIESGPLWGATIHVEEGSIYLFFSGTAPSGCKNQAVIQYEGEGGAAFPPGGDLQVISSEDNGQSWSNPTVVLPAGGTSAKLNIGRLIVSNRGSWLVPFWRERSGPSCWEPSDAASNGVPGVLQSFDKGQTWPASESIVPAPGALPTQWLIEGSIVRYASSTPSSSMLQIFRTNTTHLWQSWSFDDGLTWSDAAPGPLTAPNSKADVTGLPDGSILLAFNNDTSLRTTLTLARSTDGGNSWAHLSTIETNNQAAYSYPTVTYHPSTGSISVVYSVWQPPSDNKAAFAPEQQDWLAAIETEGSGTVPQLSGGLTTTPAFQTAGRRLMHSHTARKLRAVSSAAILPHKTQNGGRQLRQFPFNVGAWGKVSYGIRMASIDLSELLGGSQAQASQSNG